MKPVNGKKIVNQITNLIIDKIDVASFIGEREWVNIGGVVHEKTYKLNGQPGSIFVAETEFVNSGTGEPNRRGILTTIANKDNKTQLSQIFEMTIPYEYSKLFNTRAYEDDNKIEIRNYGRFTIGSRGLKRKAFFDYLRDNGFKNEICYDEDNNEYLKVLEINNGEITNEYLSERLIKVTYIVRNYKNHCRNIFK